MAHSAISATATMSYDFELLLGKSELRVDFDGLIPDINRIYERILFITNTNFETILLVDPLGIDSGAYMANVDMLYIENLDNENDVDICFNKEIGGSFVVRIPANKFFILYSRNYLVSTCDVATTKWEEVKARFTNHEGVLRIVAIEK